MKKNQKGQVSIFFGVMIMVIISLTALIINVGLFVKAKINLQNAVDAAAFSGAAVQARQLTSIAYLNWEMRNVYKEWMFKYYVLGQTALRNLHEDAGEGKPLPGGTSNFTMRSFGDNKTSNPFSNDPQKNSQRDVYNIPSVCIQYPNAPADCDTYKLPRLPRFKNQTTIGINNTSDLYTDALSGIRVEQCSRRSQANFEIAAMWAFSVGHGASELAQNAPMILADRPGAYTKAFELGVRVRNLESLVNQAPFSNGICVSPSSAAGSCSQDINSLNSQDSPHLERIVKAFYSGYRNLGNEIDREMKASFTITELPPQDQSYGTSTLSGLLYPRGENIKKYYLDLRLHPVNFATFYTALVVPPRSSSSGSADSSHDLGGDTQFTGGCDATKIAIPIPGYPFGFVKDPSTLTYYAIKGEVKFMGLFNPFSFSTKLTAYAAAKPFGGRIGPSLFKDNNNNYISAKSQDSPTGYQSRHYATSLNLENNVSVFDPGTNQAVDISTTNFIIGAPVPLKDFWLKDKTQSLGGKASLGGDIAFTIPNLVWSAKGARSKVTELLVEVSPQSGGSPIGLYNFNEFKGFRSAISNFRNITGEEMTEAISKIKAPTDYEAHNYLIPSPQNVNADLNLDSFSAIRAVNYKEGIYRWQIYAPLYSDRGDYPYRTVRDLRKSFEDYLEEQRPSVEHYLRSMKRVANSVRDAAEKDKNYALDYSKSALIFSDANPSTPDDPTTGLTCSSMAGMFARYFLGNNGPVSAGQGCPEPLFDKFAEVWGSRPGQSQYYDDGEFQYFQQQDPKVFLTGYKPGRNQGAKANGEVNHPFISGQSQTMLRNFYSTKLISLRSILNSTSMGSYNESGTNFAIFSQGTKTPSEQIKQKNGRIENAPTDLSGLPENFEK